MKKMTVIDKTLPNLNTEIEDGLTVRDVMIMSAEEAMIKAGIIRPLSFDEAFNHLDS